VDELTNMPERQNENTNLSELKAIMDLEETDKANYN